VSAFEEAVRLYTALKHEEEGMLAGLGSRDPAPEEIRLMKRVDEAARALLRVPAASGPQTAAKLAIAAAEYDLPTCGLEAEAVGMLVSEACRFLAAAHLTIDARRVA
jgi:hypothetical protein